MVKLPFQEFFVIVFFGCKCEDYYVYLCMKLGWIFVIPNTNTVKSFKNDMYIESERMLTSYWQWIAIILMNNHSCNIAVQNKRCNSVCMIEKSKLTLEFKS